MAILMLLTGSPCSLSFSQILAAQLLDPAPLKWISAMREPFSASVPAFPWSPMSPPLGEATNSSPEGRYQEGPNSYCLPSLGPFQRQCPQLPLHPRAQPVLFTWYCADGRAGRHPPAAARVKASEPINRAILRTTLVKDHCFVS